jgi:uncharacterized membrane protein YqjE
VEQQAPATLPARRNTLAVVSLVSGIVSWLLVPLVGGIVAVVTGHIAKAQIRHTGEEGNTLATVGLVLGYLHLAFLLLLAGLFLFVVFVWDSAKLVTP